MTSPVDKMRTALFGYPPSSSHEPSRDGVLDAFTDHNTLINAFTADMAAYPTVADLPAAPDEGTVARVYDDPDSANNTVWLYKDAAWAIDADFIESLAALLDDRLGEVVTLRGTLFNDDATDEHARAVFRDIRIIDRDPTDQYFLNYEFAYFPGIPLYRVKVHLHSVYYGAKVAEWNFQQAVDPATTHEDTLYLTMRADGAATGTDYGVTAMVTLDWDAVEWDGTGGVTTYVNAAATGIKPGHVQTPHETLNNYTAPAVPIKRLITVGSGGDFASLALAWAFLEQGDFASTITKSTYPSSHICSPEYPLEIRVNQTAYEEEITPFTSTTDQSPIRIAHGLTLHLPYRDTRIFMDTMGNSAPVIEFNFTGRIYGEGLIEQMQEGYTLHIDNNGSNGVTEEFVREIITVVEGVTLRKSYDDTFGIIGLGISSGHIVRFENMRMERPVNTSNGPYIGGHNSPGETHGGLLHVRNVTSDIAGTAAFITMDKQQASSARHGILVENSECPRITIGNSAGGGPGYIRIGKMDGITITGDMEP